MRYTRFVLTLVLLTFLSVAAFADAVGPEASRSCPSECAQACTEGCKCCSECAQACTEGCKCCSEGVQACTEGCKCCSEGAQACTEGCKACAGSASQQVAPFTLPPLPYDPAALEPHINARTMEIHHGKHHAAYVANLNAALEGHPDLQKLRLEDLLLRLDRLPESIRMAVRNNGGGHANHSLFWRVMNARGGGAPAGDLAGAIQRDFGSFETMKKRFSQAAATRFGSGWAWLAVRDGKLEVLSTPNQDTPLMDGARPILGLDVWEHAYYLDYQNRRPDYLAAVIDKLVNWDFVNSALA